MAELFIDVLRSCVKAGRFTIHDFVVMPNHVHILMTVPGSETIEKAMQFIKGGFSFRAKRNSDFRAKFGSAASLMCASSMNQACNSTVRISTTIP